MEKFNKEAGPLGAPSLKVKETPLSAPRQNSRDKKDIETFNEYG
jgi:hypothetical protein